MGNFIGQLDSDSHQSIAITIYIANYAFTASHSSKHASGGIEGVVETTSIYRRRQVGNFRGCRPVRSLPTFKVQGPTNHSSNSPRFGNRYYENRNPEEEVPGKHSFKNLPFNSI